MSMRDDYRPRVMELIGTLMRQAIEITAGGQVEVSVDYAGHVDTVSIDIHRCACDRGIKTPREQRLMRDRQRLSPYDPDMTQYAKAHWEETIATLNRWHDYLTELQMQLGD